MIEDDLMIEAEFWMDETGFISMPQRGAHREFLFNVFGAFTSAEGKHIRFDGSFDVNANFCLLIREAIK